jgi:RNA polymerase sigma factor (sigma-70 family)
VTGRLLQTVLRQAEALAADAGPDAVPDAELLARFARLRDEPAFAALVRRHGPMVWAVCRHLLPNSADAEDAFQATFLALVRSAGKVRTGSAVGAWLHGVAVRAALKLKRSAARRKQREEKAAGPEANRPVADGAWDELLAAVHEEVGQLPEALRTAFVLCDLEGVRQPDAAARLGWKSGTLSGRLTKARQRLLARLADRGIAAGAVAIGAAAAGAAVPAALTGKVLGLATATDIVSPAVWQLALEVTPMTVNRTKLIAACVLVAGGLGIGIGSALMPDADAQGPPQPGAPGPGGPGAGRPPGAGGDAGSTSSLPGEGGAPDGSSGDAAAGPGGPGMPGPGGMMGSGAPASQRWEYQFDALPGSVDAFRKLVVKRGQEGWEFAGQVAFPRANGEPEFAAPPTAQLVFKRPVLPRSAQATGFPGMPGGEMGSPTTPGGPGRGGMGGAFPGSGAPDPGGPGAGMGMPGMPGMMPGGSGGMAPRPAAGFQVLPLKHATAGQLATTLSQLFPAAKVVADDRTNSLILKAEAETVKEIHDLLGKLDVAGAETGPRSGSPNPLGPSKR